MSLGSNDHVACEHIFQRLRFADELDKALGRCALDDLGGTPGTLRLLSEVKPEFAKLDRGLVTGIDADAPKQDLLRAYVDAARNAETQLVGLGVEREPELDTLRAFGVELAQGYLLGLPQSAESLVASNA